VFVTTTNGIIQVKTTTLISNIHPNILQGIPYIIREWPIKSMAKQAQFTVQI
jgi:hypothetical protein